MFGIAFNVLLPARSQPQFPSHHFKGPTLPSHRALLFHEPLLRLFLCQYSVPSPARLLLTCLLTVSPRVRSPPVPRLPQVPVHHAPPLCASLRGSTFKLYCEQYILGFLPTRLGAPWGQKPGLSFLCILGAYTVSGLKEAFVFKA